MRKSSIAFAAFVWVAFSGYNISTFLFQSHYKDYVCLMNCAIDVTVGIIIADYMSGLTASRIEHVALVQKVAQRIALMELDGLEFLFDAVPPTATISSFRSIVAILRQYKSYVPASLLENIDDIINIPLPEESRQPPTGNVAIVFTDIKSSSQIWGELPDEMRDALNVHNRVIRRCIATHNGYEVKTIGDSFMVAFESLHDAISFGLATQVDLFDASWPDGLGRVPACAKGPCWNGLRVRIGVMSGEVDVQTNDALGTVDYFGGTVNIAARLEGICPTGGVAIYTEQMTSARDTVKALSPMVVDKGPMHLKGIKEANSVSVMFPALLADRASELINDDVSSTGSHAPNAMISLTRMGSRLTSQTPSDDSKSSAPALTISREKSSPFRFHCSATIGQLSFRPSENEFPFLNDGLGLVATCLIRTDGVTLGLTGNLMSFTWNVSRRVESHAMNSLRFADMYGDYLRRSSKSLPLTTISLSTSPASSGSVKSGDQRFVTVLGDAVSICLVQLSQQQSSELSLHTPPPYRYLQDFKSISAPWRK